MIFESCHFLLHKFTRGDEADKIAADMDALTALAAALVRSPDIS